MRAEEPYNGRVRRIIHLINPKPLGSIDNRLTDWLSDEGDEPNCYGYRDNREGDQALPKE